MLNKELLGRAQQLFPEFFPVEGVAEDVFMVQEGLEDFGLFEPDGEQSCWGHYFFLSNPSGKEAINKANKILDQVFENYTVVKGLTPLNKKGALWLTRQLGFKELDTVTLSNGAKCKLFYLHRDERNLNGFSKIKN